MPQFTEDLQEDSDLITAVSQKNTSLTLVKKKKKKEILLLLGENPANHILLIFHVYTRTNKSRCTV